MERRIATGLHWWTSLLLVAVCCYFVQIYPTSLIRELGVGTLVAIVGPVLVLVGWQKHWRLSFDLEPTTVFSALALIMLGLVITASAVSELPVIVNQRSVYAIHLGPFYRAIHYAFMVYVTLWTLVSRRGAARAEMGLVAILAYSVLNGGFFNIIGDRFALLYGLSLVTVLMHLADQAGGNGRESLPRQRWRALPPLSLPILLFLLCGGLATVTSLYVHNSLNGWLRLCNWALVYFLVVNIVREKRQVERLMLVALSMAAVVSVAGLGGVVGYALRMGWNNALRARLWIADKPHNGVATFAVAYITLGTGLLTAWSSRRRRVLLSVVIVLLLLCAFLTYSRSATIGLFCGLIVLLFLHKPSRVLLAFSRFPLFAKGKRWMWVLGFLLFLLLVATSLLIRGQQDTLSSRLYIWKAVLNVIWYRPLLGVGLNNHLIPIFSDVLSYREFVTIRHLADTHSHNLLLEIGEAMGLVGVGLFLWLLIAAARYALLTIRQADNPLKRSLLVALCAACVALLVPHALVLSLSEATLLPISLWILLGLIVAVSKIEFYENKDNASEGKKSPTKLGESLGWFGRAKRRRDALLVSLILVSVLFSVVKPLVARTAQRRGTIASGQGNRSEAVSALGIAARLQPFDAEIQASLGDVMTGDEAIEAYRQASALRSYYAPYHTRLGWLHWAYNRLEPALVEFEEAVALDWYGIDDGEHHSDLGLAYAAAGNRDLALAAFQEAVLLDPASIGDPDWQLVGTGPGGMPVPVLATAYTRYHETHQADEELSRHIAYHLEQSDSAPATFVSVGEPQIYLRDVMDGLLVRVDQMANSNKASDQERAVMALSNMAELCIEWGLEQELKHTLQTFESLAESGTRAQAEFHRWQGFSYQEQNRLQEAQAEFQAALSVIDRPYYHHPLGMVYMQQGAFQEGIAELGQAAQSWNPNMIRLSWWPLYWEDLARAYRQTGRLDDAITAYETAQFFRFSVLPYLQVQLAIGETYREQGNYVREIDAYVHAVEILSSRGELGPDERDLLRKLARHAAVSYRRQGLTSTQAWMAHALLVEDTGRTNKAYLALFQEEIERRLP